MFRFINGNLPDVFQSMFVFNRNIHDRITRQTNKLHVQQVKLKLLKNRFDLWELNFAMNLLIKLIIIVVFILISRESSLTCLVMNLYNKYCFFIGLIFSHLCIYLSIFNTKYMH